MEAGMSERMTLANFRAGLAYWLVLLAWRIYPPLLGEMTRLAIDQHRKALANQSPNTGGE